ncbi:MAG TPA: class I SAM-dependent methyltransferase [Solirubrobacteraceae bacterium]|jgi:cyclopropane-fatty-acyl-phospholipid synthase|nr:class I SAM-dependent methyltransferase [Solirubrobacteraceae bacterium]
MGRSRRSPASTCTSTSAAPSSSATSAALGTTGFELRDVESLREHYPLTLRRWAANLQQGQARAVQLVGSERERAWQLYMLGPAQAFDDGEITVYQVLSVRDGAPHRLPLDRARLPGAAAADVAAAHS